jgi:hypothetical protein
MKRGENIRLAGAILMAVALALFLPGIGDAGSLEPTPDAVDPSGNPVPTMKTLNEIPPSWSRILPANDGPNGDPCNSSRFKCVLDDRAVLDKETGLVWEREPYWGVTLADWNDAKFWCLFSNAGGREGWRLPTYFELSSLREYCPNDQRLLPCGHPFIHILDDHYWSATTSTHDATRARYVGFGPSGDRGSDSKTVGKRYWCVRGGFGVNYED